MKNEKTKAVIAYLFGFISGLIILLSNNTEKKTRIHAAQSVTLFLTYYIISVAYGFVPIKISYFEGILVMAYGVFSILGMVRACSDDDPKLPFIGDIATKVFKKQIEKGEVEKNEVVEVINAEEEKKEEME